MLRSDLGSFLEMRDGHQTGQMGKATAWGLAGAALCAEDSMEAPSWGAEGHTAPRNTQEQSQ